MKKIQCKQCGKIIEGYTENHVQYLLMQHKVTHRFKELKTIQKSSQGKPIAIHPSTLISNKLKEENQIEMLKMQKPN